MVEGEEKLGAPFRYIFLGVLEAFSKLPVEENESNIIKDARELFTLLVNNGGLEAVPQIVFYFIVKTCFQESEKGKRTRVIFVFDPLCRFNPTSKEGDSPEKVRAHNHFPERGSSLALRCKTIFCQLLELEGAEVATGPGPKGQLERLLQKSLNKLQERLKASE